MMTISDSGNFEFENPPPGSHVARCFKLIDLGTQQTEWQGQQKQTRKIQISFELSEEMSDGRPFSISRRFTLSLSENAALRKFLEAWRGRAFTPEELKGFDLSKLIGAPCLLNLIETERNGKSYVNISSVMPLPKGMAGRDLVNQSVVFDLDAIDLATFDALSRNLQETIKKSPEWQAFEKSIASQQQPAPAAPARPAAPMYPPKPSPKPATPPTLEDFDDDIPF